MPAPLADLKRRPQRSRPVLPSDVAEGDTHRRTVERHEQRYFGEAEVAAALSESGFAVMDHPGGGPAPAAGRRALL